MKDGVSVRVNRSIIQDIKNKEMDRKDFLKYSGLVILGLVGFKSVANILLQPEIKTKSLSQLKGRGFGGGRYGA